MSSKIFDVMIIGGGIVGLSTLYHLKSKFPHKKIGLLEKEDSLGKHQTGHNSGVIHSGLYYKPGSLKAQNCIQGYQMLIDFCDQQEIEYELCGKIVVATNDAEVPMLKTLEERGKANGLNGIKPLDSEGIKSHEPHITGVKGLFIPQTGIIDYLQVCRKLSSLSKEKEASVYCNEKVIKVVRKKNLIHIETINQTFQTKKLVNCAGLQSDDIAKISNVKTNTKIIPFRGEYYKLKKDKEYLINHLVYPVPDPNFPFLGVHFTRMINGGIEAGPNAVLAFAKEGYTRTQVNISELMSALMWPGFQTVAKKYWRTGFGELYRSFSKTAFTKALQKLLPELTADDLEVAPAGIRAQACDKQGGLLDDFKIEEKENMIHVINAPSPAATSSLAIGSHISSLKQLNLN